MSHLPFLLALAATAGLVLAPGAVLAQAAAAPGGRSAPAAPSKEATKPTWKELSPAQREALAPLAKDWDGFERSRKLKWLEVAAKYPKLSPDAQKKLHQRMAEFAKLTPEQRRTARSNFQRAYELPMEQRDSLVQQYQDLPPEQKRALADKASKKADPPRRRPKTAEPKPEPTR